VCAGPEGLPRCDECDQIAWQKIEKEEEEEARARANNPDQPIGDLEAVASPARGCSRVIKLAISPNSNIPKTCHPAAPRGVPGRSRLQEYGSFTGAVRPRGSLPCIDFP